MITTKKSEPVFIISKVKMDNFTFAKKNQHQGMNETINISSAHHQSITWAIYSPQDWFRIHQPCSAHIFFYYNTSNVHESVMFLFQKSVRRIWVLIAMKLVEEKALRWGVKLIWWSTIWIGQRRSKRNTNTTPFEKMEEYNTC